MDTIFALASAQGKAGVAIVRMSGVDAWDVAIRICGSLPPSRQTAVRKLRDAQGAVLDEALILCFEEGASFTGEPIIEFHVHGSRAVVSALFSLLSEDSKCRLAEPGEFTRRAMDNGRLTLTEVEGLADLIEAETEQQRRQAQRLFAGELRDVVEGWRAKLIHAAALIEASIDFADEEIPEGVLSEASKILKDVGATIKTEMQGSKFAQNIRDGFEVAIVGAPNVGKSTLLNALSRRDAAIVSDVAGTTRDIVEVRMDLGGMNVLLLDTAGLRVTDDVVEKIGVDRAKERASLADLRIFLGIGAQELGVSFQAGDVAVMGKSDLSGEGVSGLTGEGVDELLALVSATLSDRSSQASLVSHQRQITALSQAEPSINEALSLLGLGEEHLDLASEQLRMAIAALEFLVGRVGIEDVYDEIFASFCLGK